MTRGKLSERLLFVPEQIPVWAEFALSRVRLATWRELPTSGHLISHNPEEVRAALSDVDTSHLLVLDDTSFSGTTNLLTERQVRQAFPERNMAFTHGLLILNVGQLGPNPGAKQRIKAAGSEAIGGMEMHTPADDGWHFFDMVKQQNFPNHLVAIRGIIRALCLPNGAQVAEAMMDDEAIHQHLFPNQLSGDVLRAIQKAGHFIMARELNGDIHVRNPQLLPNIIEQGHLLPPDEWRKSEVETLGHLERLNSLLERKDNNA